ncbi:CRISPR-associated CARF protein Csa3 [Halorhabdus amylolytica]|uniref:CRISPR-associated CARF protein Csa3 n=1 Tax=Halorhabdus amylolytica TaxID=2559573 RepID=UPI0010AB10E3|nr:CRISPR-associated CARF protein Csa3 [Halorhabdus amylolytica]
MRTYISTLGFHETRVTRPVIKHGIDDGDRVVLVRPANDGNSERAADAVGYVEDMIAEIEPDATVTTEQVDTSGFMATTLQCSDLLTAVDQDRDLVVNFGGGAREVLLPLLIATVLHAPIVDQAFQYTDVDQEVETVPIPNLTTQIPSSAVDTFELLVHLDREMALPELATESDKSKSTVSRHVESLAEAGVFETWLEDNAKYVSLSQTGVLIARACPSEDLTAL